MRVKINEAEITAIRKINRNCTCRDMPCSCPESLWTGQKKVRLADFTPEPNHFFVGGIIDESSSLRVHGTTVKGVTAPRGFMLYREQNPFVIFKEKVFFLVEKKTGKIEEAYVL